MAGTEVALDLSTLVDRKNVRIVSDEHPDGKLYELRTPDELGVIEHQRFQQHAGDARKLRDVAPDRMTKKQAQTLKKALDTSVSIVLPDIEQSVLRGLADYKLAQIIDLFVSQLPDEGEGDAGPPPTGGG